MPYLVYVLFSFSIGIPAIIGGIRFRKIDPAYYPFIILLWIALANETLSYILGHFRIPTNVNNNIYVLLEAWLLMWQAKRWKVFPSRWIYFGIQLAITSCWTFEAVLANGLQDLHSIFRIIVSALYVIIFIGYSNQLIFQYAKPVVKDSGFLTSIGLVFFSSFKLLVEVYWWQGVDASDKYLYGLYTIIAFINLFVNLVYIIAVLWIPTKAKYTTFS